MGLIGDHSAIGAGKISLRPTLKDRLRTNKTEVGVFGVAVLFYLIAYFTISGQFFPMLNIASVLAIAAAGQTIVFLIGGIDLSVASVITGASVLASTLLSANVPFVPAVFIVLASGLIFGIMNGIGITKLKVPPIVMTIATGNILLGVILITTNGRPKPSTSTLLSQLVNGKVFGQITGAIIVMVIVGIFLTWLTKKSTFGRKLYMLGSNLMVAKLSGINTDNVTIKVYALSGFFSGLTGLILLGYTSTSSLNVGNSYLLPSIAAVLLGGTSPLGGKGSYIGTILGAFILTTIISMLTVLQVSQAFRQILQGLIIILFIIVNNSKFFGRN